MDDACFAPRFLLIGRTDLKVTGRAMRRRPGILWQFQAVMEGLLEVRSHGRRWQAGSGEVVSLEPGLSTNLRVLEPVSILYGWLALMTGVQWNHYPGGKNFNFGYCNNEAWMQPTPEEALGITVPRVLQGALARRVVDQLTASERLLQASGALATLYAGDRARALVAELATAPEFTAASGRSEAEQAIQQAEADARSRFRDPLYDVSSMASTCGWERGYFTRRYKELRDDTPGAYIAGLRLDAGRYSLLEPEQTVAAVAESCGYASSNGFIRAFRRRFGQTPQRWREGQSEF